MKPKDKEQCKTDSCGGFKHCKKRLCNPAEKDCRECIDDANKAIEEINKRR